MVSRISIHPPRDVIERFVPGHAANVPCPFGPFADRGIEQSILTVDALGETADLGADDIRG